jgi:hypothetical protein
MSCGPQCLFILETTNIFIIKGMIPITGDCYHYSKIVSWYRNEEGVKSRNNSGYSEPQGRTVRAEYK